MRWFLSLTCLLVPSVCAGQILLNEIYYDHPGRDDGYEFVELINLSDLSVSLSGFVLEFHDGASEGWKTIWRAGPEDTIAAAGLFVIGGGNVTPLPNVIGNLGLQNGPDAIRLSSSTAFEDRVGYGELDGAEYYEGRSAPDVPSGASLARRPDGADTDDNLADFAVMPPSPGRFNVPRRDVSLRLGGDTKTGEVHGEPVVERLRLRVINEGLLPVESGAAVVELHDSTVFGVVSAPSVTIDRNIEGGDSIEVEFAVELTSGYHWIHADVVYAADERPGNNVVEIVRRVGVSSVVVSEVMSHPREGCPEYVEVMNTGAAPYDFSGHWIRDAAHDPVLIVSESAIIPPYGIIVLTKDADDLLACFERLHRGIVIDVAGEWPSLNQSGSGGEADSVIILDDRFLPVDRVGYPPQLGSTRGMSLERVDLYPGTRRHTWVLNNAPEGGSPGKRHGDAVFELPATRGIDVSPNPFDPYLSENLIIMVPDQEEPMRVVVSVFDVRGRRLIEIGATAALPSVFVWDGRDAGGMTVSPGVYVVACEFFSVAIGTRRVEKVVVGCGRRKEP